MNSDQLNYIQPLSGSSGRTIVALIMAIVVLVLTPAITIKVLQVTRSVRQNYRGESIPVMFGLSIVISSILLNVIALARTPQYQHDVSKWIVVVLSFGTLGFLDDKWGDKQIKGLKGHFRAVIVDHRITSGLVKAIGGAAAGMVLGAWLNPDKPALAVLVGLVIALSANAMNLLDLRPGRACAAFLLLASLVMAWQLSNANPHLGVLLLVCVILPTLPAWILDSKAKVMLGDTGSNVLGAALGLAIVETRSLALQIATVILLVALHVLAERRSITEIIAGNKMLNSLDKLTGVRD